jgi:hypothetical protein
LGEVLVIGDEGEGWKNNYEDTGDNIGDNATFFLIRIRTSVIILKYNPII